MYLDNDDLNRYSIINIKNKREIVLLRGTGCIWKKCSFCDYHDDFSTDKEANFQLNKSVIEKITGLYRNVEIINSGSFTELDKKTIELLILKCKMLKIEQVSIESHWIFRNKIEEIRAMFHPIYVKAKIGIESFDIDYRENVLKKGMGNASALDIKKYFNDCCLLIGIVGQTKAQILNDIQIANENFDRVCINVFVENTSTCKADQSLISWFIKDVVPTIENDTKFDILLNNTDFGVG